jgi:hypothetical protein
MFFLLWGFSLAVNKHSALSAVGPRLSRPRCAQPGHCMFCGRLVILDYLFICLDSRRSTEAGQLGLGSTGGPKIRTDCG